MTGKEQLQPRSERVKILAPEDLHPHSMGFIGFLQRLITDDILPEDVTVSVKRGHKTTEGVLRTPLPNDTNTDNATLYNEVTVRVVAPISESGNATGHIETRVVEKLPNGNEATSQFNVNNQEAIRTATRIRNSLQSAA